MELVRKEGQPTVSYTVIVNTETGMVPGVGSYVTAVLDDEAESFQVVSIDYVPGGDDECQVELFKLPHTRPRKNV